MKNNFKSSFVKSYPSVIKRNWCICFIILNFFVLSNSANAQQLFQKELNYNLSNTYATSVLYNPDSTYYVLGTTYCTPTKRGLLLIKTDSLLNELWTKSYFRDSLEIFSSKVVKVSDTTLLILATSYFPDLTTFIIKTDLNGDTIWTQEIKLYGSNIRLDYLDISGDTLLLFGNYNTAFVDATDKSLLVQLNNNNGQLINAKSYNLNSHLNTIFTKVVKKEENNIVNYYMIGFGYRDSLTYKVDVMLIKWNQDLSIEYLKVITSDSWPNYSDLSISQNNNKVLCGFVYNDTIFGATDKYCYVELDTLLNVNWTKRYHYLGGGPKLSGSRYITNSNTILCVDYSTTYELDSIGNILSLSKTYSNPTVPAEYGYYNASSYQDNKIIWVGSTYHSGTPTNKLLITATDEHGKGCHDQIVPSLITETVINVPYDDSSMTISPITLETSIGINDSNVILNSAVICAASTSIKSTNDISKDIILYPNPCNEKLYLRTDANINGPVFIKIFSIMGALVYENTLNKENFTIDTSSLRSGVYFIKASSFPFLNSYSKIIKL